MTQTYMDRAATAAFLKMLTLDGREIVYRDGKTGNTLKITVLVDEITPEARDFLKVSTDRNVLQITALASALKLNGTATSLPRRGDSFEFRGQTWGLIPGGNRRFYDYEEAGEVTVTFYAQAES